MTRPPRPASARPAPFRPARLGLLLLVAGGAVALAGCLPSSQRELDRSVSAADSASVALAAAAPVDTLDVVWEASPALDLPTSLGWYGRGVAVVETQGGAARLLGADGADAGRVDLGGDYPYLAGVRGDTVVVLARGADQLRWAVPGRGVVRDVPAPPGATAALVTDSLVAVRTGGGSDEEAPPGAVEVLDEGGAVVARHALTGPPWRSIGFLRAWGGRLAALSGYRPVVDVLAPSAAPAAPLDTLALVGFASPQLTRSAQYVRGDVDEPPLLTSSAAPLGDRLFVLNLRGDHLRVDVYDRAGRLERVLVGPERSEEVYPLDLAVRETGGAVELAVLMARPPGLLQAPASRIVLYRWTPQPDATRPPASP
ncbi:hypothetical protein RQM47_04095 [Rubrivirga sp. S365]|uniref:hypothetical protein n=1 Tax=Rubrivirga sp. S365 TaxID=3076080 RepID=UPI0028CABC7C|nr:hypothetical protein [Rubrivirga sp. S365]MDT7855816.1 hypothetical protein [Rubrivirga sp. S365]